MTTCNDETLQRLSALMDGHLDSQEAGEAVAEVLADPALKRRWAGYHAISDAMSQRRSAGADGLARRIAAALDAEPPMPASTGTRRAPTARRRPRPALMPVLALAASVAVLAVAVGLFLNLPGDRAVQRGGNELQARAPAVPPPAPATDGDGADGVIPVGQGGERRVADTTALTRLTWNDPRPQVERRLNGYLLNHNEYLATGVRGMLPYARVVGYEPND
jgi:sigma-E factor negative regulatory protein RseA